MSRDEGEGNIRTRGKTKLTGFPRDLTLSVSTYFNSNKRIRLSGTNIYRSLIQPYLLYGITAWGRADKIHRNKILCLQKRALRLMFFGDYKAHTVPFFISSSLLPLDLLYFKSVAVLMYDVSNNTSPPQISNLFNYQHNIHSHNTRSSTKGNFFLEYSRLDKLNMSFSRNGVRVWNNLSNEIRQMPKVKFKRNIHNMLLQKLSEANEYIDLLDLNMS